MNSLRYRGAGLIALSIAAAVVCFVALFLGHTNHSIAGGVALLGFVVSLTAFNKGWDLLHLARPGLTEGEG
jgi:hypothetical protein